VTGIAPIASVVSLPGTESPMFAGLLRLLPKVTTAPAEDGITSKARITAPKIDRRFDPMQAFERALRPEGPGQEDIDAELDRILGKD
jgi:hypothetical protein